MKICLTGARGRLGSILGDWLEKDGHQVIRFSRNADAKFACLSDLPQQIRQGTDAVLHLAWSTVPASAERSPGIEWREDLPLLSALLNECIAQPAGRSTSPLFVFFSSCSVYGEFPAGRAAPFSEGDECKPKGWYASGKKAAEDLLAKFTSDGLRCLVLRVSNPFGFVQSSLNLQGFIPVAANAARQKVPLSVWGDGKATKDFLDVRDLYSALASALSLQMTGTFNVCSGQSHSLEDVIRIVEKTSATELSIDYVRAAPWDVGTGLYSNSLFSAHADWSPRVTLEQGIRNFMTSSVGPIDHK